VVRLQNGDDAVAYLAGQPPYENRTAYPLPTLLLLDIKLPRRSGHEILAWIRARQGELGRLPVVILTSSRQSVDVTRAYDLGANSYLVKPESAEQLAALAATFKAYWLELNQFPDTVSL
jgi:CheY-like chemotaxis protein